jgi:ankyrin repeat protein
MTWAARILAVAALAASTPVSISAGQDASLNAGLFRSIRAGDISGVENLLRQGADVNARQEHGATPLMYAALYSPAPCMQLLLEKGADPNAKNKFGATALMWGADDAVKVRMLIANGADVNARAASGRTALMAAAATRGAGDAVSALIEAGADVKARDSMNRGAVSSAAESGDVSILRQLLAKGADPNEPAQFGSALMSFSLLGNPEAVNLLAARGANINFKSEPRPQFEDGSWLVKSRSVKFQPYFQSGFPHGHDQWISAAGTAWAAMALALTLVHGG